MRTYDFSPLYRSFVGFDRMANLIDAASQSSATNQAYPPYNVVRVDEDSYKIEMAVAGFDNDDIEIESHENVLSIIARREGSADNDGVEYLHRGIAERGFERRFQLADHVIVKNAELRNGLLTISLKRELPEALKPRKIAVHYGNLIEAKPSGKSKAA
ncbi:Hsp20 family protein [Litorimonas sp. RW-G-Af-16]|uniref:Hsp20 family protein n=1 Tax=Litorimonas sp. RW-G-Af-16 TaxID=3241168 RepID=UPI00390C9CE6